MFFVNNDFYVGSEFIKMIMFICLFTMCMDIYNRFYIFKLVVVQVECLLEVQENVLEKFRQGIMVVSKKKILVKLEDDSDVEEKGRM